MHRKKTILALLLMICLSAGVFSSASAEGKAPFHSWGIEDYSQMLLGTDQCTSFWEPWTVTADYSCGLRLVLELDDARENITQLSYDAYDIDPDRKMIVNSRIIPLLTERAGTDFGVFDQIVAGRGVDDFDTEENGWQLEGEEDSFILSGTQWDQTLAPAEPFLSSVEELLGAPTLYNVTRTVQIDRSGSKGSSHPIHLVLDETGRISYFILLAYEMDSEAGTRFFADAVSAMLPEAEGAAAARFVEEKYAGVALKSAASTETDGYKLRLTASSKGLKRLTVRQKSAPADAVVVLPDWMRLDSVAKTSAAAAETPAVAAETPAAAVETSHAQEKTEPAGSVIFSEEGITITTKGSMRFSDRQGAWVVPLDVRNDGASEVILENTGAKGKINGFGFSLSYDALVPAGGNAEMELVLPKMEELGDYCITDPDQIGSIEFPVYQYIGTGFQRIGVAAATHMDLFGTETPEAAAPAFGQTLRETVLGEYGGATLRLMGISPDGKSLILRLDNSEDERRCAILQDVCVNGWQLNGQFQIDANRNDYIMELVRLGDQVPGFKGFRDISFTFRFYRRMVPSEPFYETLEKKDRTAELHPEPAAEAVFPEETGTVLFDQKGCRLLYRGCSITKDGAMDLDMLFINESGKDAYVVDVYAKKKAQFEINGSMVAFGNGILNGVSAKAGMRREVSLRLLPYDLNNAGIRPEDIRTLDFSGALYINGKQAVTSIPMHIDIE